MRRFALLTACAVLWSAPISAGRADDNAIAIRQDAELQGVAFSADGTVVATVGVTHDGAHYNSTIKFWNAGTGELVRALDQEAGSFLKIAFSREYLAIAVNGTGTTEVRLLDAATGELRHKVDKALVPGVNLWMALAFSSDGKRLATAGRSPVPGNDGAPFVKLWHIQNNRLITRDASVERLPEGVREMGCVVFSPDGRLVAGACNDSRIRLFNGLTGELSTALDLDIDPEFHFFGSSGIAFSPDSKTLASPGRDNAVLLWDVADRKQRMSLKGHAEQVCAVAFSPDGRLLATGGRHRRDVFLWDATSGERKRVIPCIVEPVVSLAFSPDGRTLAVCSGGSSFVENQVTSIGEIRLVRLE